MLPSGRELETLGWWEGRNIRIDSRHAPAGAQVEARAQELIAQRPDLLLGYSVLMVAALRRESGPIPIVFAGVSDPIGAGFIANLARPGGNLTGLTTYEASIAGHWLQMLKEIAPRLERAAVLANPKTSNYDYYLRTTGALASSLAIELSYHPVETAADIERTIESFARTPDGGLVVLPDATANVHRELIVTLAARHRLPAVYPLRIFVTAGGLMSYGTDRVEEMRQVAYHVDRILRGAKPADLAVHGPTNFETVVNLKTAKSLGLTVPTSLLLRAGEVIE